MRLDFLTCVKELRDEEGDNKIAISIGKTGSGKTLLQTEIKVLPLLLDDIDVWCCYFINLDLPNLHYFAPKDFDKVKDLRNSTIVFDEIRRSFEPRAWETETEEFRSFVELHRHRHNDIIGNTQDVSLVSKSFSIQTHFWSQVEHISQSFFFRFIDKIFNQSKVVIKETYLNYSDLKKLSNGYELNEEVLLENTVNLIWKFPIKNLIHHELDDIKVELVHRYCKKCRSRQGEMILRADTDKVVETLKDSKGIVKGYRLKVDEFCPKHKKQLLTVRESGVFDTDYEPEVLDRQLRAVYYETCKHCGKDHPVK